MAPADHGKDKTAGASDPAQKYGRHPVDWDTAFATLAEGLGKRSRAIPESLRKTGNASRAREAMATIRARKRMVKAIAVQLLSDLERAENDLLPMAIASGHATRLQKNARQRKRKLS